MSTSLSNLLEEHAPEEGAIILQELINKHAHPDDPLYDLLRLFQITVKTNEQVVQVGQQIPEQLRSVIDEIDERFDRWVAQWRGLPADVTTIVKDAVSGIIPEIQSQAKDLTKSAIASELADVHTEIAKEARDTFKQVAHRAPTEGGKIDPKRIELQVRLTTMVGAILILIVGMLGGCGFRTARSAVSDNGLTGHRIWPSVPSDVSAHAARHETLGQTMDECKVKQFSPTYRWYVDSTNRLWRTRRALAFAITFGRDVLFPRLPSQQVDHIGYRNLGGELPIRDIVPLHHTTHQVVTALRNRGKRALVDTVLRVAGLVWLTLEVGILVALLKIAHVL